jgi:hypothetical protein
LTELDNGALHPAVWLESQENEEVKHGSACVIPGRFDPDAACLIPAVCDVAKVRKLFLNEVRRANRKTWLPRCQQHWEIERNKRGLGPLPRLKLVKSSQSKYRWIALAAYDLNRIYAIGGK